MIFVLVFLLGFFFAHAMAWMVTVPTMVALLACCALWVLTPYVLVVDQ